MIKVNEDVDIRNFCPKCYTQKSNNIKHCFICDKCVEDFNHHCFWINKCIGKNNRFFYFLFIFFSLFYVNHSLYICFELLLDNVNLPYETKILHIYIFERERGFRVLGTAIVGVFSLIVGMPLWFLFLIEILKTFGLYGRKKYDENSLENVVKKATKEDAKPQLELQGKEDALLPDDEKDQLINNNDDKNNINIPNNNIYGSIKDDNPINDVENNMLAKSGEENNIIPDGEIKPSIIPVAPDNSEF